MATPTSLAPLHVGASGFSYPTWRPGFYPAGTPSDGFLRFYAERLSTVELNSTFYRLPSEEQLRGWAEQTPPGFRFAVKMNRRITQFRNTGLAAEFCERVRALGDRLGPIRVQLPPDRPRDDGWLELLLGSLDPELEYSFDFRHPSWDGIEGLQLVNALDGPAGYRYVRLREPPYDDDGLRRIADRLAPVLASGTTVYAYFKHEDEPTAPAYAQRLLELGRP